MENKISLRIQQARSSKESHNSKRGKKANQQGTLRLLMGFSTMCTSNLAAWLPLECADLDERELEDVTGKRIFHSEPV